MISIFNTMIARTYIRMGINEVMTVLCDILRYLIPLSTEGDIELLKGHVYQKCVFPSNESKIRCDL